MAMAADWGLAMGLPPKHRGKSYQKGAGHLKGS